MGRRLKEESASIVVRNRAGRFRFRDDVVGELVAWLTMRARIYLRSADSAALTARDTGEESTLSLAQTYRDRANVCLSLATQISDEWSAVEYLGVVADLHRMTGLTPCSTVPNAAKSTRTRSASSTRRTGNSTGS